MELVWLIPVAGLSAVFYAAWLAWDVLRRDSGTPEMQNVASMIFEGAMAFLRRQYRTIAMLALVTAVIIGVIVGAVSEGVKNIISEGGEIRYGEKVIGHWEEGLLTGIAFLVGAAASALSGYIGMYRSVRSNSRTASAAPRSLKEAITVSLRGGAVSGFLVVALSLLGVSSIFFVYSTVLGNPEAIAPFLIVGFGFGASFVALFAQLGGGIYTKAADVGADLVGKVEAGIPEDDPRNAAVVADLVGDNVGDCAGMAADIFESYEVTIVSALILGLALMAIDPTHSLKGILFSLIFRGIGAISSILGTFAVPIWTHFPIKFLRARNAEDAMFRSYEVSSINTIFWAFLVAMFYANDWRLGALIAIGVGLAVSFNPLTSYFTATDKNPVKDIVKSTRAGPAPTILSGLASGYESTVWALLYIVISIVLAMLLYPPATGIFTLYAVAMIGIGMLSQTGNNVALDSYGPISDNANGIGEMAWHDLDDDETKKGRQIMADLDSVGNTTKAITTGIAIAPAVIAAVSLFASYVTSTGLKSISVSATPVFIGLLLGGAMPWLFSSLAIRADSRAAKMIVEEVRRQFRIPGVMEGQVQPDYRNVVTISTAAAQKELVPLAVIALPAPMIS